MLVTKSRAAVAADAHGRPFDLLIAALEVVRQSVPSVARRARRRAAVRGALASGNDGRSPATVAKQRCIHRLRRARSRRGPGIVAGHGTRIQVAGDDESPAPGHHRPRLGAAAANGTPERRDSGRTRCRAATKRKRHGGLRCASLTPPSAGVVPKLGARVRTLVGTGGVTLRHVRCCARAAAARSGASPRPTASVERGMG